MVEFKETAGKDGLEVVVDGIWRGHLWRDDGPPRLAVAGVDARLSLEDLEQITARLKAFASKTSGTAAVHNCPHCICGRRAPVQRSEYVFQPNGHYTHAPKLPAGALGSVAGSVTWDEHERAWATYGSRYSGQSAQRIAERGGFSYNELTEYLGRPPETWMPRGNSEAQAAVTAIANEQRKAGTYREW